MTEILRVSRNFVELCEHQNIFLPLKGISVNVIDILPLYLAASVVVTLVGCTAITVPPFRLQHTRVRTRVPV